jgi:hypothetical protein
MVTHLGVGEAIVPLLALEAGVSWFLAILHAAEERLLRLVQPVQHILQDVRVDVAVLWSHFLDVGATGPIA